jgi:four helix bundle protein
VSINSYRDLQVWQAAMDLVQRVYAMTRVFPKSEQFGLTHQLQRSAVSIPSNIAEGHARAALETFFG